MNKARLIALTGLCFACRLVSQTTGNRTVTLMLPVVTLMDVEPAGTISLNYAAPSEAGNALTAPPANTTKWINYTSAILPGGATRRITASVNQLIPGTDIRIQAAAASGSGGGALGIPSGPVVLTTAAQTLISGIGGAFTGNGANNGHRLTISIAVSTYAGFTARTNTPVVIVYTITE